MLRCGGMLPGMDYLGEKCGGEVRRRDGAVRSGVCGGEMLVWRRGEAVRNGDVRKRNAVKCVGEMLDVWGRNIRARGKMLPATEHVGEKCLVRGEVLSGIGYLSGREGCETLITSLCFYIISQKHIHNLSPEYQ